MSVRVRFAPSPTGFLHLGGVRTALISYLFAKNKKGCFILRVENTDLKRGKNEFLHQQLQNLQWLGLKWDEGPHPSTLKNIGSYGPYQQSQRLSIYQEYAQQLISQGKAYYCFLTESQIETIKQEAIKNKKVIRVISPYRDQSLQKAQQKIKNGESAVIRFKVPQVPKIYTIKDIVRGEVNLSSDTIGDFVLLRASGVPVYNFSCAIDDHLMKISHCFRSEEHLVNTLRQLIIYEAFMWAPPLFGHLSIILGEDRKKLSKRHGATSCQEYKNKLYYPEAILNFLALMGWNPKTKQEIFLISELIDSFCLEGLNASPGVFNTQKLDWINYQHLKNKTNQDIWNTLEPFFIKQNLQFPNSKQWQEQAMQILRKVFTSLPEAIKLFYFLSENNFTLHETSKEVLSWPSTLDVLKQWQNFLSSYAEQNINAEIFSQFCKQTQKQLNIKGKFLFMPMRVAILGQAQGLELKQIISLIKKDILIKRVTQVINTL